MQKFAVFDIDGTLIRWQLYHATVDRLAKEGLLGPGVHKAIHEARMVWKRREHPRAFHDYEQAVVDAYDAALKGLKVADLHRIIEHVTSEYKTQTYQYTRDLARRLKEQGYVLLAISGSHQELVEAVGKQYGFDHCLGTQYLQRDGRFTGEQIFVAGDKAAVLQQLIDEHRLTTKGSYAIGDSKSDIPMLAMVERPIAFNPNRELYEEATKQGWPIVVERKNVVYELTKEGTAYQLN